MREMECKQMDLVVLVKRAELYAGDYPNPGTVACFASGSNSVDGVVVGEGKRRESAALRRLDYSVGRESAVRGSRVGMQVDERGPVRLCTHRA